MAEPYSEEGLTLIPRTRTVSRRRTKAGRYVADITFEELSECFDLPKEKAAERLGVGVTILKRVCRRMGIERWPYRRDYHKPKEYSGVSTTGDSDGGVEPTVRAAQRGGSAATGYHHLYAAHNPHTYSPFAEAAWPAGFDVSSAMPAIAAAGAGTAAVPRLGARQATAEAHRSGSADTEIISIGATGGDGAAAAASAPADAPAGVQGGLDLLLSAITASGDGAEDAAGGLSSAAEGPASAPAPAPVEGMECRLRRAIETNPEFAQLLTKVLHDSGAAAPAPAPAPAPPPAAPAPAPLAVEDQLRDELSRKFLAVQAELAARRVDLAHLETYISSRLHAAAPVAQMAAALQAAHAAQAVPAHAPMFGGAPAHAPAASQASSFLTALPGAASGWVGYPHPASSPGFAPWGSAGVWGQH